MSHVDTAAEVWILIAVNFLGFFLGAVVTAISYWAYRTTPRKPSLRNATIGFWFITLGIAVEPIYRIVVTGLHVRASGLNVPLQIFEGSAIALGLLLLFVSVYGYSSGTTRHVTLGAVQDGLLEESD